MKVLIVQRVVPDYRVPFYKKLADVLTENGVVLRILAGQQWDAESFKDGRKETPNCEYSRNLKLIGKAYWQRGVLKASRNADLVIFEQANAALHIYVLLLMRMLGRKKPRLAYWGHGMHLNKENPEPIRDAWKKLWICKVDHWFAYTELSARIVAECRFPKERITVVQNAIDTTSLRREYDSMTPDDKKSEFFNVFSEKYCEEHRVGVFCARLVPLKWIPFLLVSVDRIYKKYPDFRMIIIGDGPERDAVREFCASNTWCKWVGAIHGRERVKYLALGDIMLNPGMSGLSILDAFAVGIPFATTDSGIHSPEIAYVKHAENGLLCTPTEDIYALDVLSLLTSDQLSMQKKQAYESGSLYTISGMSSNYSKGILKVLKL